VDYQIQFYYTCPTDEAMTSDTMPYGILLEHELLNTKVHYPLCPFFLLETVHLFMANITAHSCFQSNLSWSHFHVLYLHLL